jgi:hypothetical protein
MHATGKNCLRVVSEGEVGRRQFDKHRSESLCHVGGSTSCFFYE